MARKTPQKAEDAPKQRALALLERAQDGDAAAMAEVRAILDANPSAWNELGDLARATEGAQLKLVCGDDLPFREGLTKRLGRLRDELAGPDCSPLERLLAERIVACWLLMQYADVKHAQMCRDLDIRWGEYFQQRQDRAHRRFLSACKTLATIRKLAVPVLQVNIGDKQVNIAHSGGHPVDAPVPDGAEALPRSVALDAEGEAGHDG